MQPKNSEFVVRPPVVVVMGHIDHGKSKLLDYVRKTNIVDKEAGGITQHVGAYEVIRESKNGEKKRITFLDTPGHEAFAGIRARGVEAADIAVLVVSAEEGVKAQTMEALAYIKKAGIPFVVAINKIDKPEANIERTKQSLAENEIYIEGYGGTTPAVAISAKEGTHVDELLDMILLVAELEELKGNAQIPASGAVIESHLDPRKGISATLIIKNGVLEKSQCVVAGDAYAPVRAIEDFLGKPVSSASFSSPVIIFGWNKVPAVGLKFETCSTKKEAEAITVASKSKTKVKAAKTKSETALDAPKKPELALVIKADTSGSVEATLHETATISDGAVTLKILQAGVGDISENDVKIALGANAIILGFNASINPDSKNLALRSGVQVEIFDLIYKLKEWIAAEIAKRTPKVEIEETTGKAKIQRVFGIGKSGQVVGGKVESGQIKRGGVIKIIRRDAVIGEGKIKNLEQQKVKTDEVGKGREFGALIESKFEIAGGDFIESFTKN